MVEKKEIAASAGRLRRRLEILQDHQRSVWFGEGFGLFIAALVPALGVVMALDNLFRLHWLLRCLFLVGLVAGAVALIRRVAQLLREPLTPERMAVKVEAKFPQVDNRIINALLLANEDDPEASELIHSVVEGGNSDATRLDLRSSIPKRKMGICLGAATLALVLMGAYGVVFPGHFMNALARCLVPFAGINPLTRTRIVAVTPKDQNVLSGDDVMITVDIEGRLPDVAQVVWTPEEDEKQVALMQPEPRADEGQAKAARYRCSLADVAKSFRYHVAAGDAESGAYRITVHHRPVVSELNAHVAPPAYTGLPAVPLEGGTIRALPGSAAAIRAQCSKPIASATLVLSTAQAPIPMKVDGDRVSASFAVATGGTYHIELTDTFGFENKPVERDIEVLVDEPPEIVLDSPPVTVVVQPTASIPFQFTVSDRYGVRSAELVQLHKTDEGRSREERLQEWPAEGKAQKVLKVAAQIPVARLGIEPGKSGSLQIIARDWNDVSGPGIARSPRIIVTVMSPQAEQDKKQRDLKLAALELAQIIQKQRHNIQIGTRLRGQETREPGTLAKQADKLGGSIALQEEVRAASGRLLDLMDKALPMRGVVKLLYEDEMVKAVRQLRAVAEAETKADPLEIALATERVILARLTGRSEQLKRTLETAALRDIFSAIEALIREQKKVRTDTLAASQAGVAADAVLTDRQDKLAGKAVLLKEQIEAYAREVAQSDAEQAKRFEQAAQMVDSRKIRANMLVAASRIGKAQFSPAVEFQDKIIADLRAIADFLREPIVAAAAKKLKDLQQLIQDAKDKTDKLAKLQAAIKEISEELERSKDNRGDDAKELAQKAHELEGLQQKIDDVVEQIAKDLALFPEVPSCNELVQEMREVFEDVEQQEGSEAAAAEEIAVDRDEGMLEGLDKVKERIADMEMWLMDKPDNIQWKQEAWDKNEMPDIPLVDLPEEMEDLVGDLVDKEEEVDEQAQDSASNAATPDIPAGWDVADGPISNWSAKGKSGNEKPNANEMAGRSGSGREGNANGELVEGKAKDLEGRETKARRTHDPFGEGMIEEENPESKAKATGGGKQSGAGGEGGMRGTAPARNELGMRELERRQRDLRRNTQAVYSKASLMYLPTGELDAAIVLMHKAEQQARAGDFTGFSETQRRIVHALRNTKKTLGGQKSVEMDPRQKLPMDIKEEMFDARDEPIPPEFEELVAEYYKAIATGLTK